ncbi:hypothetical protein LTS08_005596 [Lithohypha guttulata]|uniref:uncharacterized protein n=1 Tax=Lithohypha guttulata TaxID=1690604 RepID=UPI002DDFEC92|nr:hypothetical protein LTR51_003233 [Lithohypha guttulata]KAK5099881.1 hypothetical protein LTS08_005596 [Lithohypha guttulata]
MKDNAVTVKHNRNRALAPERPSRQRGRPLRSSAYLERNRKHHIINKLRKHHAKVQAEMEKAADRLSTFEKLPVELIQQIFFYALEVNLPSASRHLRQVLSDDLIYNALIILAYFDDDLRNPVESKHFLPAEYRRLSCDGKVSLQKSIFTCRWCTYQRIVSCLPALSRLAMVQAWHSEHSQDDSHEPGVDTTGQDTPIVANQAIRELAPLPKLDELEKLEQHYLARATLGKLGTWDASNVHQNGYLPRIVTWSSTLDKQGGIHKGIDRSVTILGARHISSWLLGCSVWTTDRLSLLQLLRQGYTFIQDDHVMSISVPAVFEGMRNAIRTGHAIALKTLLELHSAFFKTGASTFRSMMFVQLTPPTLHSLPLDLFHLAAEQGTLATELLTLLLRAGIDALPHDDEVVTTWAVHESHNGNALAVWLLKHMEGTANYGLPRRSHLFVDGCLSWRARGDFPFPETTFAFELDYIAGTPVAPLLKPAD